MVVVLLAFHYHVVHAYFNISSNLLGKRLIHKSLICHPRFLQSKQHDLIAKEALACDKQSLLLVRFVKLNLIVAGESVYEGQQLVPICRVYKVVDL